MFNWNLQDCHKSKIKNASYFLVCIPCFLQIGILFHALCVLKQVKFEFSKIKVALLLGSLILFTLSMFFDGVMAYTDKDKVNHKV